jgi:dipeptidyl aminopeptidase/acylaminoacyl peptidase
LLRPGERRRLIAFAVAGSAVVAGVAVASVLGRGHAASRPPQFTGAVERLVYARPTGHSSLAPEAVWSATPANGSPIRLATGSSPLVSPNGRWVAYIGGSVNHPAGIRLIASGGGKPRRVRTRGTPVAWSPDSRRIAVLEPGGGLAVVDAASLLVTTPRLPRPANGFSFSPNGRMLVFDRDEPGSHADLFTLTLATGAVRRLTHDGRSSLPVWGGPGIAFARVAPDGVSNVWLMRPDGSSRRRLTHVQGGAYPEAWSSNGGHLLAAQPALGGGRLVAVDVAAGKTWTLTGDVGDIAPQGLSRDGHTVLAAVGCGDNPAIPARVETIPFAGGPPTIIVRGACSASWNA